MTIQAKHRISAALGQFIDVPALGVVLRVVLNDDGQPTVLIDTEGMRADYRYDDRTGLTGTAEPYTVREYGASAEVIAPSGDVVSRHFPSRSLSAKWHAQSYANVLNEAWSEECDKPDIQVLMGDATLYDSEDHNPDLRERRQGAKTDV